jgi:hypothetical protein
MQDMAGRIVRAETVHAGDAGTAGAVDAAGDRGEIEGLGVEAEEIAETASRLNELIDRKARQSQPPGL